MCGIAGISGPVDSCDLRKSLEMLAHRGPDGQGVFEDHQAGVGLVHARLSILDLSSLGRQPMASPDHRIQVVYNGEIYNFRELRQSLESRGVEFRSSSDTEVLLHMYLVHGEAMLPMLNGIFAFAIWDRELRSILLARDALGVKPLYYSCGQDRIAFASEIKSLRCLVKDLGPADPVALDRYLTFLWCPGDGTPVKGVRKMEPGEAMWVREGKISRRFRWYELPSFHLKSTNMEMEAALDGTVRQLRQAVHRQMVSDVPVGAFLSGGLDSSSIVAFARELNPGIRCFTIDLSGGQESGLVEDLPYARQVANHLQVPLDVIRVDSTKMADDLESMVYQLDEPLADPAPLNARYICKLARQQGIKVLLSGAGGDDLFTGYRRHRAVTLDRFWNWLPRGIRTGLDHAASRLNQNWPPFRKLSKLFNGLGLDGDERLVNYFVWCRRRDLLPLYSRSFRQELGETQATAPLLEFVQRLPKALDPVTKILALEQRFFLADHNLCYTDKMSMAEGVEARVPFLDLELVEFAASIPSEFKQRRSIGKWVLKKSMEAYLPNSVIYRSKSGFGAPLRRWMRNEFQTLLGDVLSPASLARRGFFDPDAVQRLIRDNTSGRIDASYTLLSLLCIEIWFRQFQSA
jgi:asparagine synthase (glutamine-hydrolysing)